MTTNIGINAHCSDTREVKVFLSDGKQGEVFALQDGEEAERVIHSDIEISVKEFDKDKDGNAVMSFEDALKALKSSGKVARTGWNGKGMWLEMQVPDEHSKMTRPYIYMILPKGSTSQFGDDAKEIDRVPWLCSQTDMLASDWIVVE